MPICQPARMPAVDDIQCPADICRNKPGIAIAHNDANTAEVLVGKNLNVVHEMLLSNGAEGVATLRRSDFTAAAG